MLVDEIELLKAAASLMQRSNIDGAAELLRLCSNVPANVWGQIEEATWHRNQARQLLEKRIEQLEQKHIEQIEAARP